ncbi:MAG: protein translocase subunit SecF [Alphaproteobacteria bacterium]|nr:protein translocase subunit SecF [Alphaproteobacteria bacterium]
MRHLKLIPEKTNFTFMRWRNIAFALTALLTLLSVGFFFGRGLNLGIDFAGGIVIEVRSPEAASLGQMRAVLSRLPLGEVALQEFGSSNDVLIRIQRQEGDERAQQAAVEQVREALKRDVSEGISFRRVEFVGPKVSGELIEAAIYAVLISLIGILVYIWFRFEWQYGLGAVVTTVHDAIMTVGFFAVTGLEFNLTSVAAILTVIGYSINDTVVVYDRVRENMRKYKTMPLETMLDLCINETLSRTVMTGATTLLALLALFMFGGEVIRSFTAAMIFGIIVGTYSSVFVAAPILIHLKLKRGGEKGEGASPAGAEAD